MVVNVMNGNLHGKTSILTFFSHFLASIKGLEGYTAIHRLFLKFVEEYPSLLETVRSILFFFSLFFDQSNH
jgi:hypothetical protein